MAFNFTARPADHRTITTGKWRHIFLSGEALTFTLSAGAATSWQVRNYYNQVVASGTGLSTSATTLTLNSSNIVGGLATLALGWFKLYLIRGSAIAAPWGTAGGELPFVLCRSSLVLPGRPSVGTSRGIDFSVDYPTSGFARFGPYRHSLYLDSRYASSKSDGLSDAALEASTWGTADAARPLRPIACFPEGTGGSSPSGTDTANISSAVSAFVAAGVTRFEGRNEPNSVSSAATFYAEIQPFAATVRAAGGLVLGPCTVEIGAAEYNDWNSGAGTGYKWVGDFLALGGGTYIDEFSFHNYNGLRQTAPPPSKVFRSGLPYGRSVLDRITALLAQYGQQDKARFDTEAFSQFAAHFGSYEPRLQTQNTMLELMLLEQYSVPKERTSIFYHKSHGFWDYPSWIVNDENDQTLNPLVAVLRVYSEEVAGKTFAQRLDFGTSENDRFIGSRLSAASGTGVLTILSPEGPGQVTLQVSAGTSTLEVVDPWGTVTTQGVVGGLMIVNVDSLPIYVRLPAGVTANPVAVNYGADVITPRALSVAVSNPAPTVFPATKSVAFPNDTRFDRVIVSTDPIFQTVCGLIDFDVQALRTDGNAAPDPTGVSTALWTLAAGTGGTAGLTPQNLPSGAPYSDTFIRARWTVATSAVSGSVTMGSGSGNTGRAPVAASTVYSARVQVRSSIAQRIAVQVHWYTAAGAFISSTAATTVVVTAGAWTQFVVDNQTSPATAAFAAVAVSAVAGTGGVVWPVGATLDVANPVVIAAVSADWSTLVTELVPTDTITWASYRDAGACYVDSFYSRRNRFAYKLSSAVQAAGLRVLVRDMTYGGAANLAASNGAGLANRYDVAIFGSPTGGSFTLTWNGLTTGAIAWNASAATVQTALRALAGAGSMVATGGPLPGTAVTCDFGAALSYRSMTATGSLTGGSSPSVGVFNVGGPDDTRGTSQAGPRLLACDIAAFLSGKSDGGSAVAGQPMVITAH